MFHDHLVLNAVLYKQTQAEYEHMTKYWDLMKRLPEFRQQIQPLMPRFCTFDINIDQETLDIVAYNIRNINDELHSIYTESYCPIPIDYNMSYEDIVKRIVNRFCIRNPEYDLIQEYHMNMYDNFKDYEQRIVVINKCDCIVYLKRKFKRDRRLLRKRLNNQRVSTIANKKIMLSELKGLPLYSLG